MSIQDYKAIFLQQPCCADEFGDGRMWCQDDVFTGECEESAMPTKYIRADIHEALEQEVERLKDALRMISEQTKNGFIICSRCGHQDDTKDHDVLWIAGDALDHIQGE